MPDLPARFAGIILAFAPLFVHRSWCHARVLLVGAILAPGRRTIASLLRIMGRACDRRFVNVYRVLNRAAWSPRAGACILAGGIADADEGLAAAVAADQDGASGRAWALPGASRACRMSRSQPRPPSR